MATCLTPPILKNPLLLLRTPASVVILSRLVRLLYPLLPLQSPFNVHDNDLDTRKA